MLLIVVTILIIWGLDGCHTKADDNHFNGESLLTRYEEYYEEQTSAISVSDSREVKSFYLVMKEGQVIIYNEPDRTFYDYADINIELLPPEIFEQLKLGLYIDGENELYDFLQTYSS